MLYLDGEWQTLVDGLSGRAGSLGVEFTFGRCLSQLNEIKADAGVLAVGPNAVERLTGAKLLGRRAAYAACLDLCLSRWPEGAPTAAFALDRLLYYSVHSAVACCA